MVLPKFDSRGSVDSAVSGAGITARWTATSEGSWNNVRRWSSGVVPKSGSIVILSNSSTTVTTGITAAEATAKSLRVQGDYTSNIGVAATPVEISAETCVLNTTAERVNLKGTFGRLVIGKSPSILTLTADSGGGVKELFVTKAAGRVKVSNVPVGLIVIEEGTNVEIDGITRYGAAGPHGLDGPDVIVNRRATLFTQVDEIESLRNSGLVTTPGSVGKLVQVSDTAKTVFQTKSGSPIQGSDSFISAGLVVMEGGGTSQGLMGKIHGGAIACADGTKYTNSNLKVEGPATFRSLAGQTVAIA
jgi:hypothetical protein